MALQIGIDLGTTNSLVAQFIDVSIWEYFGGIVLVSTEDLELLSHKLDTAAIFMGG